MTTKNALWSANLKGDDDQHTMIKFTLPTIHTIKEAFKLVSGEDTQNTAVSSMESQLNLIRLCIKEINGKKVVYSDLIGDQMHQFFSLKQVSILQNYFSQLQTPNEEDMDFFFKSMAMESVG